MVSNPVPGDYPIGHVLDVPLIKETRQLLETQDLKWLGQRIKASKMSIIGRFQERGLEKKPARII